MSAKPNPEGVELNAAGRCNRCGGILANVESRRGCSRERLIAVHSETCPGVDRGGKRSGQT